MRTRLALFVALGACAASAPPVAPAGELVTTSSVVSSSAHHEADAAVAPRAPAAAPVARDPGRSYREAVAAAERNDFTEAARLFGLAFEASPSVEMAFNAFRMHERAASVAEASQWYERILGLGPPAAMRADLEQRMAALRDFARRRREDIARPPPGVDALVREASEFFGRGVALYQRREYRAALQAFEAALRYMQESRREVAELYFNLAVTHEHLRHRAEAAAAFREYLSRRPDTPDRASIETRVRALSQ